MHGRLNESESVDHHVFFANAPAVANQRNMREKMSTHMREALEALGSAWQWRINAPPVTNTALFEKLRADDRVKTSGGMDVPVDIPGIDAMRLNTARKHYNIKKMHEADRAIVDAEFPGLAMTARDASFYLSAKAFAAAHPGAKTLPSYTDETVMYNWLKGVRNSNIDVTDPWRVKVLDDFGLAALLETLKPPDVLAANIMRRNAWNAERNSERDEACAEAREVKRRRKMADIVAGPTPIV